MRKWGGRNIIWVGKKITGSVWFSKFNTEKKILRFFARRVNWNLQLFHSLDSLHVPVIFLGLAEKICVWRTFTISIKRGDHWLCIQQCFNDVNIRYYLADLSRNFWYVAEQRQTPPNSCKVSKLPAKLLHIIQNHWWTVLKWNAHWRGSTAI